jgi:hypothetical protein
VPLLASRQCCCFATCLPLPPLAVLLPLLTFMPWLLALLCCCLHRCTPALPVPPIYATLTKAEPLVVFVVVTLLVPGRHWTSRCPKPPATLSTISEQRCAAPRHQTAPERRAPPSSSPATSGLPLAQPPPPRGPHRRTTPLRLINSRRRPPGCPVAVELARLTTDAVGSPTPVSTPPSDLKIRPPQCRFARSQLPHLPGRQPLPD